MTDKRQLSEVRLSNGNLLLVYFANPGKPNFSEMELATDQHYEGVVMNDGTCFYGIGCRYVAVEYTRLLQRSLEAAQDYVRLEEKGCKNRLDNDVTIVCGCGLGH